MKILGIETSCDETACSVVEDGKIVLSNVIASQIDLHAKTGGVVPEVAAREHVLKIIPVVDEALKVAGVKLDDIDAVAVTQGPGLISSLIIGTETASVISFVKEKPLIPVQHIKGHIYSNWLEREEEIEFPLIVLTVSGGHNELILMRGHDDFEVLGETLDDAAGEAFDKVARILGLGYPGGPAISRVALEGDKDRFDLPKIYLEKGSYNFSFSGLKTACLNEVKEYISAKGIENEEEIDDKFKADLAAGFQESVVSVLSDKLIMAQEKYKVREIHLAGGVSANQRLREDVERKKDAVVKLRYPKQISFCTDNAAMIAGAGFFLYQKNKNSFSAKSNVIPTTDFRLEIS